MLRGKLYVVSQVWSVMPATLVEAERKGAELVQRLAQNGSLNSNGRQEKALSDATSQSKQNSNGHQGSGLSLPATHCEGTAQRHPLSDSAVT